VSCIRLVASGLFFEARGGVKPSSEKRSVLSPGLSGSLSSTQGADESAGSLDKELEATFSSNRVSAAGSGSGSGSGSGCESTGGRPPSSSMFTPVVSTAKAVEESAQGRDWNIPLSLSDLRQLSLSQSLSQCQSIVDRVALFLHRVGYAAVREGDGGSSLRPNTDPCKSVSMARAYVRLWLALNEVKGRDPHPVVGYAAAVLMRRITVHMGRDVDRSHLSATRHVNVGGSDSVAPESDPLDDSEEEDELVEYEHEPALVSCLYKWARYVLNSYRYPFPFLLSVSCPVLSCPVLSCPVLSRQ
jgi:hypothetical protein